MSFPTFPQRGILSRRHLPVPLPAACGRDLPMHRPGISAEGGVTAMEFLQRSLESFPNHPGQSADSGDGHDDGDGQRLAWSLALLSHMRHCSCMALDPPRRDEAWNALLARSRIRPQGTGAARLVERARQWIECHADDEQMSVDQLASALNMSRTSLHRKLVSSIGHPPGELIRLVRLQLARRLLCEGEGNVSEVAYAVGFVSLSGFSRAYRHHYGEPPSSLRGTGLRPATRR
ncbi:helix-turn-helix transcriptional regulator [Stenotrophomonas sp.]|uniref:helix-turn-helix transcriptional regulator n=1 Tax=Stenotrophomonas sp. TaxID=69392 RepID=UPI0028A9CEE9|nr:helix-turn-helix transcriptional regulator [Stenotrophomonas sp.]